VRLGPVLGQLPLGLDPVDAKLESDYGARLRLDVTRRRIVNRPRIGPPALMSFDQAPDVGHLPVRFHPRRQRAVSYDGGVVPRRHDLAGQPLLLVPRGRDVSVGTGPDGQRAATLAEL